MNTKELLPHLRLRFTIDHPSFEECYSYGYDSALAQVGEEENPYPTGSSEYDYWQEGWWAGFYGEEPLFTSVPSEPAAKLSKEQVYPFISNLVNSQVLGNLLKITGALAATVVVGYQVIELVA
jgi:hypothetical protein